jgi:hypothetical protein
LTKVQGRKKVGRKTAFKESDQGIIDAYREWFKLTIERVDDLEKAQFKYLLDKILFIVGKQIDRKSD